MLQKISNDKDRFIKNEQEKIKLNKNMQAVEELKKYRGNYMSDTNSCVISRLDTDRGYFPLNNLDEIVRFNNTIKEVLSLVQGQNEKLGMYKQVVDILMRNFDSLTAVEKEDVKELLESVSEFKTPEIKDSSKYIDSFNK